ncbi:hypothetical protein D9601_08500 [Sphingomonas sp. MA1305]|uniref:hypothetical protein n=1 Tax=Sphingomonas sp. MA1305 TaxID=2479204 RepID=UPI0018E023FD|nr:hypothetical protein [Sphingomonas sp. MA1305]MBI0475389.1 hypothetical protein [Sphingomonas sp. MA1305]
MSLIVFLAVMFLCCAYALWRGGAPERISAGAQIAAFALGLPLHLAIERSEYREAVSATALVDVALLLGLIVLAWRSTRFWPLWVAAWQFAAVIAHMAKLIDPTMQSTGYAIQAQIWAYPMLLATAIGAWRHQRRLQEGSPDPSWKPQLI